MSSATLSLKIPGRFLRTSFINKRVRKTQRTRKFGSLLGIEPAIRTKRPEQVHSCPSSDKLRQGLALS